MKAALIVPALMCLCALSAFPQTPTPPVTSEAKIDPANAAHAGSPPGSARVGKAALALPPEKSSPVRMVKFDKPPVIDGRLDDEVWKTASVLKDFYQVQPGDNLIPQNRTEVMLGYDARHIYIAFHC